MANKKYLIIALFVVFPLIIGLACRGSSPDPTATPTEEEVVLVVEPTEAPTETPTEEPTAEPTQEPTEDTKPLFTGEFQDLIMLEESLWVQEEYSVFVAFFLENLNSDVIFDDVEYTIELLDANGEEIESENYYLRWIFPNETVAIVTNLYLSDESKTVDSVNVDWDYGDTQTPNGLTNPFSVDSANFWPNSDIPYATGSLNNSDPDTYTDIRANIICYNSIGEIVGGGYTFVDFIPGNSSIGFSTYLDTYDEVASIEVFPIFTYSTLIYEGTDFWSEISFQSHNFNEGDFGDMVGGAVIKNETDTILQSSMFYVTFYDSTGVVTATGYSKIDVLFPGESIGISPWTTSPPDGVTTTEYEILVLPGEIVDDFELTENPFVVNSKSVVGDFDNRVAVNFTNNYSKSISDVNVYVLVYNAEGQIIGGGESWITETTPAGGSKDVEVWVNYASSETIETIDVWIAPWYWASFE